MRPEELVARARRYERELRRIESERREMRERIDDAYWRGRQDERRAADGQPATATVLDDATSWLRTSLDSGPLAVSELRAEADAAGIAFRTLKRAKCVLGVRSVKRGASWFWETPEGSVPSGSEASG